MQKAVNCHENKKTQESFDILWKARAFAVLRRVISSSGNKSLFLRYLNKLLYAFVNTLYLLEPELIAQCTLQKPGI